MGQNEAGVGTGVGGAARNRYQYKVPGEKKVLFRVREDVWRRVKAVAARRGETVWGYVGDVLLATVEVEEGKRRVGVKPVGGVEASVSEALEMLFGEVVPSCDRQGEEGSNPSAASCGVDSRRMGHRS